VIHDPKKLASPPQEKLTELPSMAELGGGEFQ